MGKPWQERTVNALTSQTNGRARAPESQCRSELEAAVALSLMDAARVPLDSVSETVKSDIRGSDLPRGFHALARWHAANHGKDSSSWGADRCARYIRNAVSGGTGDLSNILADTINKSMGVGYEEEAGVWEPWVPVFDAADYKTVSVPKMSTFSDMLELKEGQPFSHGALGDKTETGSVTDYGRAFTLSNRAIVNDDLAALSKIPRQIGRSAAWHIGKLIFDTLQENAALGEDDTALFHADHNNLVAAGGGAPDFDALAAARLAFRNQTAPKGDNASTARRLNLRMGYVIVPSTHETSAEQAIVTNMDIGASIPGVLNPFAQNGRTPISLIVSSQLDALDSDAWYAAAHPSSMESIVLLALGGNTQPIIRSEESRPGEALGVSWDVRLSVAPLVVDFRGLYKNSGTA